MTTDVSVRLTIAQALERLMKDGMPFRFEAYDGSVAGPEDAPFTFRLLNERGLAYLMTAPGDLGFGRAIVAGDLEVVGVSHGNPYDVLVHVKERLNLKVPAPAEVVQIVRSLGVNNLRPPAPPPEEHLPRWRRAFEGLRHSKARDAEAIHHHYDVSNRFYEFVLGPSMTYTCAVFPREDATLEEAQFEKYDLVARKLDLKEGDRLLDVGCGWGGMVRHAAQHYGVKVIGVTLSEQQALWAQDEIKRQGLDHLAEVRYLDYRDVPAEEFDAVSSIGLTEHIGVRGYPAYFHGLAARLRPGGRLLNHCITRPDNHAPVKPGPFIDRYVFPDGELAGPGRVVGAVHDAGLEVQHTENLRAHYALTLGAWCANLAASWDACVGEVGIGVARVWGLYMAGSRWSFEQNAIQLHQVLATKTEPSAPQFPLRPDWAA